MNASTKKNGHRRSTKSTKRPPQPTAALERTTRALGRVARDPSAQIATGAALTLGGLVGAGALMRKPLAKVAALGLGALIDASMTARRSGGRAARVALRELDANRWLERVGLRRRSWLSRAWPALGAAGGLLAAIGAVALATRTRRLPSVVAAPMRPQGGFDRVNHDSETLDDHSPFGTEPAHAHA